MTSPRHPGDESIIARDSSTIRSTAAESLGGAELVAGSDLPEGLAPRPYLHPITTHAGVTVTAVQPSDHVHHLGLSVAVSDLNGTNFWGGSTFTDQGPRILANHGRQVPAQWRSLPGGVTGEVDWVGADGARIARERRSVLRHDHADPRAWVLEMSSRFTAAPGVDALQFSSSAVKGRAGAGYGGIFWRFARSRSVVVETTAGTGPDAAHGSLSPWLSLNADIDGDHVGIVLVQDPAVEPLPWFVRSDEYLGAGPAVAWKDARTVPAGQEFALGLQAIIRDGHVSGPEHVTRLIAGIPPLTMPSTD